MARVAVIGAPFHSGGSTEGVARGIGGLRDAGLITALRRAEHDAIDLGDVELLPPDTTRDPISHLVDPRGLSALVRSVTDATAKACEEGHFPLVIGGDCPILLGGLRGTAAGGLLHVDGHEDAYTPEESPTGASADSEIAFALGLAAFAWDPDLIATQPLLQVDRLAIVGARDLSELRRHGVASLRDRCVFADDRTVRTDPGASADRAIAAAGGPGGFWLHLDWDVLSNQEIGSVIFPMDGGITWNDLATVVGTALANPSCRGWSAGTYNPDLDPDGVDAGRIVAFVTRALEALDERPQMDGGSGRHG